MIEELLAAITRLDLTPDEVAEAIWLARFVPERAGPTAGRPGGSTPAAPPSPTPPSPGPPSGAEADDRVDPDDPRASLRVPRRTPGPPTGRGTPVRLSGVAPLSDPAGLLRALRPLRRLVEPTGELALAEEPTAVDIAETGLWLPHLTRLPQRRFDVALVVDASAAVGIWRSTVEALRVLLVRLGAFRDVRLWSLDRVTPSGRLVVREGGSGGVARDPAELVGPRRPPDRAAAHRLRRRPVA